MPSKLAAKCRACPFVDNCNNKRMEALAYLPLPESELSIKTDIDIDVYSIEKHIHDSLVKSYWDAIEKRYIKTKF